MINVTLYTIEINIPPDKEGVPRNVWYEKKDGVRYKDCKLRDGKYWLNGVCAVPTKFVKVISSFIEVVK